MRIIIVINKLFLLSIPSFLSANQLEKIPHRAFYKINPVENGSYILWVSAIIALSNVKGRSLNRIKALKRRFLIEVFRLNGAAWRILRGPLSVLLPRP